MKLIDLFLKVRNLRRRKDRWYVHSMCERAYQGDDKKKVEKRILEQYEKSKKKVEEFEALSNQLNEALATNYIKVDNAELSLATAIDMLEESEKLNTNNYFGVADFFTPLNPVGVCPTRLIDNNELPPRVALLHEMDRSVDFMPDDENLEDGEVVANPLKLVEESEYADDFLLNVMTELYKTMADIDVA